MAEHFASGTWHVTKGKEDEFLKRWDDFLQWTRRSQESLIRASLLRNETDPSHFVSFAEWESDAGRVQWRESPEFAQRLGACRALCDDFQGGDYERVATI